MQFYVLPSICRAQPCTTWATRSPSRPEADSELREGLSFAQVDQHEQGLLPRVEQPRGRADDLAVPADEAGRYVEGAVMLLSARSPELGQALSRARKAGLHHLLLDGTLIRVDRIKANRPYFSGKHHMHGMNIQVIPSPDGTILWTSGALPGKTHDVSAARIWGIVRALEQAGLITLADNAYPGPKVASAS